MDEIEEHIPYTREFVVDAGYQRTLVRAIVASAYRPWFWALFGIVAVLLAIGAIIEQGRFLAILVTWLVLMGVLFGVRSLRVRSTLLRAFPVGKVMRSGFGATQFVISSGGDASRLAYSGFDRAERRGELVWVRRMNLPRRVVYPGALFSDDDLVRLRTPAPS